MRSPTPRLRRLIAVGAALAALAATPAGPFSAVAAPAPANGPAVAPGTSSRTITLLTGDRVTLTTLATGQVITSVTPARDSTGVVHTLTVGDDTYVYPDSVLPYVAAGILDKRLFDVTALVADGYDDAQASALPLIVQYDRSARGAADGPAAAKLTTSRDLPAINATASTVRRDDSAAAWRQLTAVTARGAAPAFAGGVSHIWLDGRATANLADSTAQIGAPEVWSGGNTGAGIKVAVLDTGIDTGHPDLADRVAGSQSFVPGESVEDVHGHGTHVASTVAGTGAASGGKEKGVAPDARLVVGKVLGGPGATGLDSWIIAGMTWAAETEHARIVSMSLGDPSVVGDGSDPLSQAVDALSARTGALFVIAAGNSGAGGVSSPGSATSALTVGAVDSGDNLADFSSTGPRALDGNPKPELTAPGVDIVAARSQHTDGSGYYTTMSGTSMATPHVAGAAALLAAAHPDWTGRQIKDDLVSTTHLTPGITVGDGGAGRLDARAAVLGSVHATATAWSGFYSWPHGADRPRTRTVTYRNTGSADVTLRLALDTPAPAGVFKLSADSVTVPAGGTADVALTGDPAKAPATGNLDGQLLATDPATGGVVAHTLVGINVESERYNLTVNATGRDGGPLQGLAEVYDLHTGDVLLAQLDGTTTLRLAPGTYAVLTTADLPGAEKPDGLGLAVLSDPQVELTADRTVALDARRAHQVQVRTPREATASQYRMEWYRGLRETGGLDEVLLIPLKYTSIWAQQTTPVTTGAFHFLTRWRLGQSTLEVNGAGTEFTDLVQQVGSTAFAPGRSRLRAVHAGQGAAADYARIDARGRAVVVDANSTVPPTAQSAAAVAAGARLLLVVNDTEGRLSTWYGNADYTDAPIQVASLTKVEGKKLEAAIAKGDDRLDVTARDHRDYVYDLVDRHDGAVPADLLYQPKESGLATVRQNFTSPSRVLGGEFRYDLQDFNSRGFGFAEYQPMPRARVDYVGTQQGFTWYEQSTLGSIVEERAVPRTYAAGTTTDHRWFSAPLHPRLNTGTWLPSRTGDWMVVNIPGWGDGEAGRSGFALSDDLKENLALYRGGTLLARQDGQALYLTVPASAKPEPYRLVATTGQSGVFAYGTGTTTEWTFTSATAPDGYDYLPLVQLDYNLGADSDGAIHRNARIGVTASPMDNATRAGRITSTSLEASYDGGATWTRLNPDRDGTAELSAPPHNSGFVSLRAKATDSNGNSVTQTLLNAARLR
ncbi:S8 family serine peptidase [Kitasatospora sp. NPDC087315]|uniref:S8 family serine peptidase n=1 Tax=Kitasatospora sp. NPDC087315 TaxID=3364069 RepID=UPI00382A29F8